MAVVGTDNEIFLARVRDNIRKIVDETSGKDGVGAESEFYGMLILAGRMHDSRNKWISSGSSPWSSSVACEWRRKYIFVFIDSFYSTAIKTVGYERRGSTAERRVWIESH